MQDVGEIKDHGDYATFVASKQQPKYADVLVMEPAPVAPPVYESDDAREPKNVNTIDKRIRALIVACLCWPCIWISCCGRDFVRNGTSCDSCCCCCYDVKDTSIENMIEKK